ncbi:hypothetical protein GGR22_001785 [Flavobacterium gossypii]|uniref:Uncharacterized protein n=1 Tax=Flavobacterium gossypii TaxID=1646119 RepID=A0ABR6DPQ3_9FLAO|nr:MULTISPECIES: hypothetical protein [Flavobacterium]MBA9073659.1 hypothetical protein [Flavobacterium gossypii]WDO14100.1 hypothetical protein MH928_05225 [Flavobacterium sp. WW92]
MTMHIAKARQNFQEKVKNRLVRIPASPVEKKVMYSDDFTANRYVFLKLTDINYTSNL